MVSGLHLENITGKHIPGYLTINNDFRAAVILISNKLRGNDSIRREDDRSAA